MKAIEKGFLLLIALISTIICLGGIVVLITLFGDTNFKEGKAVIIIILLFLIIIFGWGAVECFKSVLHKDKTVQIYETENHKTQNITQQSTNSSITQQNSDTTKTIQPIIANCQNQEIPKETLSSMRMVYTRQQAFNDLRILNESIDIINKTDNIDTFLSRYEMAMRCALTLEEAKKAGVQLAIKEDYSKLLIDMHGKALQSVLYRSLNKELNIISTLESNSGKLNRINKYQQKLISLYEDEIELYAEDTYNDVMQRLESLKMGLN